MTPPIKNQASTNVPKLRRPAYKETADTMKVTYFDGKKWNKTTFDKNTNSGNMGADITRFIHDNVSKNNGNIKGEEMRTAWSEIKGKYYAKLIYDAEEMWSFNATIASRMGIDSIFNQLDKTIDEFTSNGSDGGTNVTQREQFIIMTAIVNAFKYIIK